MQHFSTIKDFNAYVGYRPPKKALIDIVAFNKNDNVRLSSSEISIDFYKMAFKRNMTDLSWYGNTEYDTTSGFLYLLQPHQKFQWDVKKAWEGYHIIISPLLLQEYNLDFSFFQYEIQEALFLTVEEQKQIETLYAQILTEYQKDNYELDLLIAYINLIFTYVRKCYKRQFETRQPLYNKTVVAFKQQLHNYYKSSNDKLPSVNYFAEKQNLSKNYFGDLIKHHTGKTASEFIQEKIISEAKKHLKSSEYSISEIGYHLGFDYPTYFARFFKKHTGKTPSQFRK